MQTPRFPKTQIGGRIYDRFRIATTPHGGGNTCERELLVEVRPAGPGSERTTTHALYLADLTTEVYCADISFATCRRIGEAIQQGLPEGRRTFLRRGATAGPFSGSSE